jgi:glycosyltransferase involved in cell wall biosynthesis
MLPSVPLDCLLAYTAEADVGVTLLRDTCENHRLALPNKLFEYIAAGVPVVASALPETERLVNEHGVGWCVTSEEPLALAATLTQALREREDVELNGRLRRAAIELCWSREQVRLLKLYEQLESEPAEPVDWSTDRTGPSALPEPLDWRTNRPGASTLLLVRNTVSHDARVLRAARTAKRLTDGRVVIVGVASDTAPPGRGVVDAVEVIRLAPWGRLAGLRRFSLRGRARTSSSRARARDSHSADAAVGARVGATDPPTAPCSNPAMRLHGGAPRPSPTVRLRRIAIGLLFVVQASALARRLRPTLVHANDWNTMWAAIAIKLICGSRLIYDSHELWADRNGRWERRGWLIACEALFVRVADQVLTTSPGHAQALAKRNRIHAPLVVRNLPEQDVSEEIAPEQPPVVVYVGGLMPGRGLEEMLEALALIPAIKLRTIGPGAIGYRASLLERARAAGLADRVELLPAVAPSAVLGALAGGAVGLCLIQPVCRSYELSLPNKLLEYASAGLPVLASDLPVLARVVREGGFGEVVPPRDPPAIAAGLARLLEPSAHSRAAAAATRFAQVNRWSKESELLAGAYRRALA